MGVHEKNGRLYFHEYFSPEHYIDLHVFERENDISWQQQMIRSSDKFRSALSDERLLWKVLFFQNMKHPDGPHEIILESMHTIMDGGENYFVEFNYVQEAAVWFGRMPFFLSLDNLLMVRK